MAIYNAGIPLYAACDVAPGLFAVAGGGGEGKHGVQNKVMLVGASQGPIANAEVVFPSDQDSPMSIAAAGPQKLVTGVNFSRQEIKKGNNEHLRILNISNTLSGKEEGEENGRVEQYHITQHSSHNVFQGTDPELYQRATTASSKGLIAVATSGDTAEVYIFDSKTETKHKLEFDHPVRSLSVNEPAETLLLIGGPTAMYVVELSTGREVAKIPVPPASTPQQRLTWVRNTWIDETHFVAAADMGDRRVGLLRIFAVDPDTGSVEEAARCTVPSSRSLGALASDLTRGLVAIATSGGEVVVYAVSAATGYKFKRMYRLRKHHNFPITAMAFQNGVLLTTGLDGTIRIEPGLNSGGSLMLGRTLAWVAASLGMVLVLLTFFVLMFLRGNLNELTFPSSTSVSQPHGVVGVDLTAVTGPPLLRGTPVHFPNKAIREKSIHDDAPPTAEKSSVDPEVPDDYPEQSVGIDHPEL